MENRISFAYFERCSISRADNAITVLDDDGTVYLSAVLLNVLVLGPGITVTHRAMETIGENGTTVIWVGERDVRMYAFGSPSPTRPCFCNGRLHSSRTGERDLPLPGGCTRCASVERTSRG